MTADGKSQGSTSGALYVVATPIGNLGDITERAAEILRNADVVACEDTRTSRVLLNRIEAKKPNLVAYHEHNERTMAVKLADRVEAGETVAVISDAGTPGLSDPGFRVVRECRRRDLPVFSAPGANALAALLSIAGLPTNAFFFAGFLPAKKSARRNFLEKYQKFPHTLALYESCHRIRAFVDEMTEILGPDRVICVGKELTKIHERVITGTTSEVQARVNKIPNKGEFTVLIAPEGFER